MGLDRDASLVAIGVVAGALIAKRILSRRRPPIRAPGTSIYFNIVSYREYHCHVSVSFLLYSRGKGVAHVKVGVIRGHHPHAGHLR